MMYWSLLLVAGLIGYAENRVVFESLGDWGDLAFAGQAQVAQQMAVWSTLHGPTFIVTSGDNFYQNGIHSVTDPKIDNQWRYVYNQSSLVTLPWFISLGNHDYGLGVGEEWYQVTLSDYEPRWICPANFHEQVVQVGDTTVQFLMIDTQAIRTQSNDYLWMLDVWMPDRLSTSTADWKIVVGHHPVYSAGDKGTSQTMRNSILPIMKQYGVDMYLCGHDHNLQWLFERDFPSLLHVISGAGGALPYAFDPLHAQELNDIYNVELGFFDATWGFTGFTATKVSLKIDFINKDGVQVDTKIILK